MSEAFQKLYQVFKDHADGVIEIGPALFEAAGLKIPPALAELIEMSFGFPQISVDFVKGRLGPFNDDSFEITDIKLTKSFAWTDGVVVSIVFRALPDDVIGFRLETKVIEGWSLADFFPEGWRRFPLDQIVFKDAAFVFSTHREEGVALAFSGKTTIDPGLTYDAHVQLSAENAFLRYGELFPPLKPLIEKFTAPGGEGLGFNGQINLGRMLGKSPMPFPQLSLSGLLGERALDFLDLPLTAPSIFLEILPLGSLLAGTEERTTRADLAGIDPLSAAAAFFPTAGIRFDYAMDVGGGQTRLVQLYAALTPAAEETGDEAAAALSGFDWQVDLVARDKDEESEVIKPGEAKTLAQGEGLFGEMPEPLQQFMASVGFAGVSFSGAARTAPQSEIALDSFAMNLRSKAGAPWQVIGDPSTAFSVTVESFDLLWTVTGIATPETRNTVFAFETSLLIMPELFRPKVGSDVNFVLKITKELDIEARFDGEVSLRDAIRTLSAERVVLPANNQSDLKLRDVALEIQAREKVYAFRFGLDAAFQLAAISGEKPILTLDDVRVDLMAHLPDKAAGGEAKTAYKGTLEGSIEIAEAVGVTGRLQYDGTLERPAWTFHAALSHPVDLGRLINTFLNKITLPDFIPGELKVESFSIDGTVPKTMKASFEEEGPGLSYALNGVMRWKMEFDDATFDIDALATLDLDYDAAREKDSQYSGSLVTETRIGTLIRSPIIVGYRFGEEKAGRVFAIPFDSAETAEANRRLFLDWNGLNAIYDIDAKTVSFTLKGWTLGRLIEAMVQTFGKPDFSLPPPWDLLDKIALDGLGVEFDFSENAPSRISATYHLPEALNLGFAEIKGLVFKRAENPGYDADGNLLSGVTLGILGDTQIPALKDLAPGLFPSGNGEPPAGQPVEEMPTSGIPGWGEEVFKLRLLALGQRIGLRGDESFTSIADAIAKLRGALPDSGGAANPIDPKNPEAGQPYYDRGKNWLAAGDIGILKTPSAAGEEPNVYAVDLAFLLSDPDLYGLRIAFNGEKVKVLDGLALDVLYRKISEDVGVFETKFSFPNQFRTLSFGAFSFTLADIEFKIYTNGDFYFDLGFPHDLDFERSFTVTAIIYGVPVLGSGGVYFGKFSAATATEAGLPDAKDGQFNPVVTIGVGAQIGLGYKIVAGPLKAGFSITVFGVIEGTFAAYHGNTDAQNQLMAADRSAVTTDADFYYRLRGVFGIQGQLYGTVDLAIISAEVNVGVMLYAEIEFIAYRAIMVAAEARVHISLKVKIGFGIFSFSIKVGFEATIRQEIQIGSDRPAPWDSSVMRRRRYLRAPRSQQEFLALWRDHEGLAATSARLAAPAPEEREAIDLFVALSDTVFSPDPAVEGQQQGAFVFSYFMDAPGSDPAIPPEDTSMFRLGKRLVEHIIANLKRRSALVPLDEDETPITRKDLDDALRIIADTGRPYFTYDWLVGDFLSQYFTVTVHQLETEIDAAADGIPWKTRLENGACLFPVFDGVHLTVPSAEGGSRTAPIDFFNYVKVSTDYRTKIATAFAEVAARVPEQVDLTTPPAPKPAVMAVDGFEPMAGVVFVDFFSVFARQIVQGAIDTLDDFPLTLEDRDSIDAIIARLDPYGLPEEEALPVSALEVVLAAYDMPLTGNIRIYVPGVYHDIQTGETLSRIADAYSNSEHFGITAMQLLEENRERTDILRPGIVLTIINPDGVSFEHRVRLDDSFGKILEDYKHVGVTDENLLVATRFRDDLFRPAAYIALPLIRYLTGRDGTETLRSILERYNVTAETFAGYKDNRTIPNLFNRAAQPVLRIPRLHVLPLDLLNRGMLGNGVYAKTARVCTRQLMPGLRLDRDPTGMEFDQTFLYGGEAPEAAAFGLQQLVGQQFPVPEARPEGGYIVKLTRNRSYDWIRFEAPSLGAAENPIELQIPFDREIDELIAAVAAVRAAGRFAPPVRLPDARSFVSRTPATYGLIDPVIWSVSNHEDLRRLTGWTGGETGQGVQPQPYLWTLPAPVASVAARRSAVARATGEDAPGTLTLLPGFDVVTDKAEAAIGRLDTKPLAFWAPVVSFDLKIQRLAPRQVPEAERIFRDEHDLGEVPAAAINPFIYEVVGVSAADAARIADLLRFRAAVLAAGGADVIEQIFVAYAAAGADTKTIVGRGSTEYVSLIAETSRIEPIRTGPLGSGLAAGEPLSGIQPDNADFLSQLWELSMNREGGYYLLYATLADKLGLPDQLFSNDGAATVQVLIGLPRTISFPQAEPDPPIVFEHRFPSFVDMVLTYENLDPALNPPLLKAREEARSVAPAPGASFRAAALALATTPGDLGAMNRDQALPVGTGIPLGDFDVQVTPYDRFLMAQNPDPLPEIDKFAAVLAARFCPTQPGALTARDLEEWNPNVPFGPNAVYRLKLNKLSYTIPETPDPVVGTTLETIGRATNRPAEAIGTLFADRPNPFAALRYVAADYDFQPSLGTGNAGLSIERDIAFPDPGEQQLEDPGQDYLNQRFTQISSRILGNLTFDESAESMPAGSRTPDGEDTPRHVFDQTVNTIKALKPTANPARFPKWLPRNTANPYAGVGTSLQLRSRWLDLYGNAIASDWSRAEQASPATPTDTLFVPVGYVDRLVGVDAWPNVAASYWFGKDELGKFVLNVCLEFNTTAYEPNLNPSAPQNARLRGDEPAWQTAAKDDFEVFEQVIFQLCQSYEVEIGGRKTDIPAVDVLIGTSLRNNGERKTIDIREMRDFVSDCGAFLDARRAGQPSTLRPKVVLSADFSPTQANPDPIFELTAELVLARSASLCDPVLAADESRIAASTAVLPNRNPPKESVTTEGGGSADLSRFAEAFETLFSDVNGGRLKLAVAPTGGDGGGDGRQPLWVVKMANEAAGTPAGLTYSFERSATFETGPLFFAPRPVATRLRSGTVRDPWQGRELSVAAADMNLWLANVFASVDALLEPTFTVAAEVCDLLSGRADPQSPHHLETLLQKKVDLANAAADSVELVVEPGATVTDTAPYREAARRSLYAQMLNRLSSATALSSVAVFDVADAAVHHTGSPGTERPVVVGAIELDGRDAEAAALSVRGGSFALSPVEGAAAEPSSKLAVTVSTGNPGARGAVKLALGYSATMIEHDFRPVPQMPGYTQSSFLTFLRPPAAVPLTGKPALPPAKPVAKAVAFPNVLRVLPRPPRMVEQWLTGQTGTITDPEQFAMWDYRFTVEADPTAVDSPHCRIVFNDLSVAADPDDAERLARIERRAAIRALEDDLFDALGAFDLLAPEKQRRLVELASRVGPLASLDDPEVGELHTTFGEYIELLAAAANAYDAWVKGAAVMADEAPEGAIVVEFDIEIGEGTVGTDRTPVGTLAITNFSVTPADGLDGLDFTPLIQLDPDRVTTRKYHKNPENGLITYYFERKSGGYLDFDAVRRMRTRELAFRKLNLFRVQNAQPWVQISRNRVLGEGLKATPGYVFTTPMTSFPAAFAPSFQHESYDLDLSASGAEPRADAPQEGASRFEEGLSRFFRGLTRYARSDRVYMRLSGAYSYDLTLSDTALPRVVVPINLMLPTAVTIERDAEPAEVAAVAQHMAEWAAARKLNRESRSKPNFTLDFEIFSGTEDAPDKRAPLLRIRSLHSEP